MAETGLSGPENVHTTLAVLVWKLYTRYTLYSNKCGLVARKPVFGVSDKVILKPVSSATETSQITDSLLVIPVSLDMVLS